MPADRDWKTQRLICVEVLQGREEAAFRAYQVSVPDQVIYRQMADEAVAKTVARRSAAKRYFKARIKNPIWISTTLSCVIAAVAFAIAIVLTMAIDLDDMRTAPILGGASAFSAIGVAAMGWGISAWIAHRNNRSKYTLEVVASRFSQSAFTDALASFNKMLRQRRIDAALISRMSVSSEDVERRAVQGLLYLFNYFEFISVGFWKANWTNGSSHERCVEIWSTSTTTARSISPSFSVRIRRPWNISACCAVIIGICEAIDDPFPEKMGLNHPQREPEQDLS